MKPFLEAIWNTHGSIEPLFGEVRYLGEQGMEQLFYPLDAEGIDQASMAAQILDLGGSDVYYGVTPRLREGGKAGDTVEMTGVLWADVDAKHTGGKEYALYGLLGLPQKPSIIVDSGHGYHAYWILRELAGWADAEQAMRNLAREVRGDAVYDRARILRVPGTHNHKDPAVLEEVRLLVFDRTRLYRIDDFDLVDHTTPFNTVQKRDLTTYEHRDMPSWLAELIVQGAPKGERSEAAFKVALWLTRYGRTPEEIFEVFEIHPDGIGAKYHEMGARHGTRWLNRTIEAAVAAA